jgi:hypothetical protein
MAVIGGREFQFRVNNRQTEPPDPRKITGSLTVFRGAGAGRAGCPVSRAADRANSALREIPIVEVSVGGMAGTDFPPLPSRHRFETMRTEPGNKTRI